MSQIDILKYLEDRAALGDYDYYRPSEIARNMRKIGYDISDNGIKLKLLQLTRYGFLEAKLPSFGNRRDRREWSVSFRLKRVQF